jgi:hypothetical protein
MTRYGSDFPEPPWTYAPKEVEKWLTGVTKATRLEKFEAFKNERVGTLENLEIVLDVDAKTTRVQPSNLFAQWLQDLTSNARFERHFEVPAVAELVLRALAKGRYHSIVRVKVDNEELLNNPNRPKDVRGAVELLTEASHRATRCDAVEIQVLDDETGDAPAHVTLRRVLKKGEHAIGVRFQGEVREEDFRAFLSYLTGNLNATFVVAPPS